MLILNVRLYLFYLRIDFRRPISYASVRRGPDYVSQDERIRAMVQRYKYYSKLSQRGDNRALVIYRYLTVNVSMMLSFSIFMILSMF